MNCSNLVYLDLERNQLAGDVPWEFGKLTKLQVFHLGDNLLTSLIPPSLANCSKMEYFSLGRSDGPGPTFSRPSPPWIGAWGYLSALGMDFMGLTGTFPSSLFNCTKLEWISIYGNMISGSIPPKIGNCSQLWRLQMAENHLIGEIPDSVVRLTNLQDFIIHSNYIQGSFPFFSRSYNSSVLERIELGSNNSSGTIPSDMGTRFPNFGTLGISSNNFHGNLPPSLGNLSRLTWLQVGNNGFDGSIPSSIGNLSSLGILALDWNNFTGTLPTEVLVGCSQLYTLTMSLNILQGALVEEIDLLHGLYSLDISGNQFSGPIPSSLRKLVSLVNIYLALNNFSGSREVMPTSPTMIFMVPFLA